MNNNNPRLNRLFAGDNTPTPIKEDTSKDTEIYIKQNLQIKESELEFLQNYAYTKSLQNKEKYTLKQSISDVIQLLKTDFITKSSNLMILPSARKRKPYIKQK